MPKDTVWLGNNGGSFILLDSGENISEENLNAVIEIYNSDIEFYKKGDGETTISFTDKANNTIVHKVFNQTQFDKDVAFYDKVGFELSFILLGLFCYTIYYAIRRFRRKKRNPLGEDESDWVELGSRNKYNSDFEGR